MSEVYRLQPVTETFYELEKQLSLEIQGEYRKQSWDYLIRYLNERLEKRFFLFAAAVPKSVGPLRWEIAQHRALGLEIIVAVARRINATEFESPTLRDIAEHLSDVSLLSDVDLKLNILIAFHVVGWLTGIWDPANSETDQRTVNRTTLRIHDGKVPGQRRYYHTDRRAVDRPEVSIAEIEYRKIYHVMAGIFGRLLPYPEQALKRREDRAMERSCDGLQRIYFSWQAVSKLGFEIAWTSTLNDHLRMDQRHRRLFLYQHPSLCRLHYNRGGTNLLSRFFNEEQHERAQQRNEAFDESDFAIDDFFDDLIRSYLVVFGPVTWLLNARPLRPKLPQGNRDPLLDILCSTDRRSVVFSTLYQDFEIPPRDCDVVRFEQFPFLGERLRTLGEIGHKGGNPLIPWKLWVEGVHPNGHLYMCIVLVLGIVAVLLQGPQTIASLMGKKCSQQTG
jgi:hypothetical protein